MAGQHLGTSERRFQLACAHDLIPFGVVFVMLDVPKMLSLSYVDSFCCVLSSVL